MVYPLREVLRLGRATRVAHCKRRNPTQCLAAVTIPHWAARSTECAVMIILLFFALPYTGVSIGAFMATWRSLTLVLAAFADAIFWAGIFAVPRGQWEAARSTGLSQLEALAHVVLPRGPCATYCRTS